MKILTATPDRNSTRGAHTNDFTGAFDPECRAFMLHHRLSAADRIMVDMDGNFAARQRQVVSAIEQHAPESFVWFGHGLPSAIPQLGLDSEAEVARFTGAIAAASTSPIVVFYACSMGGGQAPGGDGGIADRIRDGLVKHGARGCRVFAHTKAGHTTWNPYVRVFDGPEVKPENVGGHWVVDPGSPRWVAWRQGLHGPLRFQFPYMTAAELAARLDAS